MIKYYVIKYKKELLACQDKAPLKALPGKKIWCGDARVIGRNLVQCMCNRYLLGNTDNPVIKFLVPIQDAAAL
jgi:hypothetical protein